MSIPWIFGIALLLLKSIYLVGGIYHNAGLWKKNQIILDDLAIEIGKSDRGVFNRLREVNFAVAAMEPAHHSAHVLKNSPWPWISGPAKAADIFFEWKIRLLINTADVYAKTMWRMSTARGKLVVGKINKGKVFREDDIPVSKKTCLFCRLETSFKTTQSPIRTDLAVRASPRDLQTGMELVGNTLFDTQPWNYKLDLGKGSRWYLK